MMNFNESRPLVSVYIPTRNRSELCKRAVNSVLSQDYENFEVIVVDDASTIDDYNSLIKAFDDNQYVSIFRMETSQGACFCRNFAISKAKGSFITGLDDDDYFEPDRIKKFVDSWNPSDSFLYTESKMLRRDGLKITSRPPMVGFFDLLPSNSIGNQIFSRRYNFIKAGCFDTQLPAWQDYDLWLRMTYLLGPGRKINVVNYVMDISHEEDRISKKIERISFAKDYLIKKYIDLGYVTRSQAFYFQHSFNNYPGVSIKDINWLSYLNKSYFKFGSRLMAKKIVELFGYKIFS
ncbi:glycosyltransferase [Salinivibrio proteolyticus]|uniref:Glycosyltransferase n=1 Tax=Salinivibrio proteolyticus TaxID=334715 RepID=A0ABY7L9M4_9GAMM|nr:glycosyltransferase [Salinivibrio proteolyticus]WBA13953.1 glycosyltransferase [Salinivibrio proteolyticus]